MKKSFSLLITLIVISFTNIKAQGLPEKAIKYFSDYMSKKTMTTLIGNSLPNIDQCKKVFSAEADAKTYFDYITKMKESLNAEILDETFVDISEEHFTTEDIKAGKGNYAGGMSNIVNKLNPKIEFYKIELLREKGATAGMAYNYWIYIDGKWVFFAKPWKAFKQ